MKEKNPSWCPPAKPEELQLPLCLGQGEAAEWRKAGEGSRPQARPAGKVLETPRERPCAAATWRKLSKSAEKKREMKPCWASSALAIREA